MVRRRRGGMDHGIVQTAHSQPGRVVLVLAEWLLKESVPVSRFVV